MLAVVVVCPRVGSQHIVCVVTALFVAIATNVILAFPFAMLPANPQRLNCRSGRKKKGKLVHMR